MVFLLEQFVNVISELESPRPASGMPKQIINRRKARQGEPFFITSGNARIGIYTVAVMLPGSSQPETIATGLGGIQESRRWIERYIEGDNDPDKFVMPDRVVIDRCDNPDRLKPEWNRWILGTQWGSI
ncbi:hypothetical protein [Paenibacillus piri]|uniref:Uncharacterized protein n=1 Tax=Paenibacillus piri TaxID=2547395 RepID=A0A4R5KEE3_9BACL|nr:hypothetical protein [Paenibacillus piri]TDF92948.1 hypothetical protein E1757_28105 [Paenibacillus piri]